MNHTSDTTPEQQAILTALDTCALVSVTDSKGTITYANDAFLVATQYSLQELLGQNHRILKSGDQTDELFDGLWQTISASKTWRGIIKNRAKDGSYFWVDTIIIPLLDANGRPTQYVSVRFLIDNPTETASPANEEPRADHAQVEFVSVISHQLRTPLTAINWYTDMLLDNDGQQLSEEQKTYINEIRNGSRRMSSLVNAVLNVSRVELGTFMIVPTLTDLAALCREVVAEFAPALTSNKIKLHETYEHLPKVPVDENLFRLILRIFLDNARLYTSLEGSISVSLKKQDKAYVLAVTDTGMGIPKQQQQYVFNKLFRADNVKARDNNGTGLGLYVAKAVVDGAKGKIWFESTENHGATFYFSLPLEGMHPRKGTRQLE